MKTQMQKLFRFGCAAGFGFVLCLVTGCQSITPQERHAANERTCLGYGFSPGSAAMERCLSNLDPAR